MAVMFERAFSGPGKNGVLIHEEQLLMKILILIFQREGKDLQKTVFGHSPQGAIPEPMSKTEVVTETSATIFIVSIIFCFM